jgi:hypothetical protein
MVLMLGSIHDFFLLVHSAIQTASVALPKFIVQTAAFFAATRLAKGKNHAAPFSLLPPLLLRRKKCPT